MEESKLNEYIESIQRLGAHGGIGGLGTATFGEEEIVEDEEMKKDPKYELYKHFVKPGYKRVIKNLTVFEDEDEKPKQEEEKKEDKKEKKEKKHKKDKKDKKEKKDKKDKKHKKDKKDKKEKKDKKDKKHKKEKKDKKH
ncbi:hypothetical protein WA577_003435 [Blastocystis sp. JDR]